MQVITELPLYLCYWDSQLCLSQLLHSNELEAEEHVCIGAKCEGARKRKKAAEETVVEAKKTIEALKKVVVEADAVINKYEKEHRQALALCEAHINENEKKCEAARKRKKAAEETVVEADAVINEADAVINEFEECCRRRRMLLSIGA